MADSIQDYAVNSVRWLSMEDFEGEEVIAQKVDRKRINKSVYEKRPVTMYDTNGNFIKRFPSIAQASYHTGIHKDTIGRCCKHEGYYKTAGGYKWEYAD